MKPLYTCIVSHLDLNAIPQKQFHHPEHNLPGRKMLAATAEDLLTIKFAHAYMSEANRIHRRTAKNKIIGARQVAVNGFGIADFVSVSAKSDLPLSDSKSQPFPLMPANLTVRAFEVKITNWRKGMMQACRYRFYANAAILVLPYNKCSAAIPFLETFRRIHVGLWGFDAGAKRIINFYTPRPEGAKESKYWERVIGTIARLQQAQ